jgi:hypothetical protein
MSRLGSNVHRGKIISCLAVQASQRTTTSRGARRFLRKVRQSAMPLVFACPAEGIAPLKEVGEPLGRRCALVRLLQLLPGPQEPSRNACDGCGDYRAHLDDPRASGASVNLIVCGDEIFIYYRVRRQRESNDSCTWHVHRRRSNCVGRHSSGSGGRILAHSSKPH